MKVEAYLDFNYIVHNQPPFPWLTWCDDAVKSWLKSKGFKIPWEGFEETILMGFDPKEQRYVFTQKLKTEKG